MKNFSDFAQSVWVVLFVLIVAVSSLQAQNAEDAAKIQMPANVSAEPAEQKDSSVVLTEKTDFRPAFQSSRVFNSIKERAESRSTSDESERDFRLTPKTSFFPKKDEVTPDPAKNTNSLLALPPRKANVNVPQNQTASPPAKQTSPAPYVRETKKERFKDYVRNIVGPYSLLGTAVFAGIFQYRDLPPEWENDSKGYARRFASALGILAINETTVYALDEAFKLDSDYYKSTKKTIKGRLQDSIVNTLMARKPDGKRVFGFPRIAGNYSSAIIADTTWYPKRFGVKDGIVDGTYSIGVDVLFNIAREFLFKGK
jgi:hypothetical protein